MKDRWALQMRLEELAEIMHLKDLNALVAAAEVWARESGHEGSRETDKIIRSRARKRFGRAAKTKRAK